MYLSNDDIITERTSGSLSLVIDPFHNHLLQPASYDVTFSGYWIKQTHLDERGVITGGESGEGVLELKPNRPALVSTRERFEIPANMIARVEGKSSWGRRGLIVHITAGFIDPGFCGHITLELYNLSAHTLRINPHEEIAQICFAYLNRPANPPYEGRYQHQNVLPQEAR